MELIQNEDKRTFTFKRENGTVDFTASELSLIVNQFLKIGLRESIEAELRSADGDTISINAYPYTYEELVDEIYVDLEDEVDYGNMPTDEDIQDKISEVASFYDMEID